MICFENIKGDILDVSYENDGISTVDIQGLGSKETINRTSTNGYNGAFYVSSQTPEREITIILSLEDESEVDAVYDAFLLKQIGIFYYKSTFKETRKIECRVESVDIPPNAYPLKAQVILWCEHPFFSAITPNIINLSEPTPMFEFPFTLPELPDTFMFSDDTGGTTKGFVNDGDIEVGMIIEFTATGTVVNPSLIDVLTDKVAKINYTMSAGDKIMIDTRLDNHKVILSWSGTSANISNYRASNYKRLSIKSGENLLKYNADSGIGNLKVTVTHEIYYSGV